MAHDLRADLDRLLAETCHGPVFDGLGQRRSAQQVAEIVREPVNMQIDGVGENGCS